MTPEKKKKQTPKPIFVKFVKVAYLLLTPIFFHFREMQSTILTSNTYVYT